MIGDWLRAMLCIEVLAGVVEGIRDEKSNEDAQ